MLFTPRRSLPTITIIGRGFSGTAFAISVLHRAKAPLRLVMIDRDTTLGGGTAYGRATDGELLNARARNLSLFTAKKDDFSIWLSENMLGNVSPDPSLSHLGEIFVPRSLFAEYVGARFLDAADRAGNCQIDMVNAEAEHVRHENSDLIIRLKNGDEIKAQGLLIATGYGCYEHKTRLGMAPFAPLPTDELGKARRVVIVVSGLSAVDTILKLRKSGYRNTILVVSRHGRLPLPHASWEPPKPEIEFNGTTVRSLFKQVRQVSREENSAGRSWQGVVNRLRQDGQSLWQGLSIAEKTRFYRHLKSLWDIHRYRTPPDVHHQLLYQLENGSLVIRAGRVFQSSNDGLRVKWKGAESFETVMADMIFDCTGHCPALQTPLVASLLKGGLVCKDKLGIGLEVKSCGLVSGKDNVPPIFALGPLGAGSLLEITGVPEIVQQAEEAAERMSQYSFIERSKSSSVT